MSRDFSIAQHAIEVITSQYDSLKSQDVGHSAAIDFICWEHGLQHIRSKVAALVNDHRAGLSGQSGETVYGSVATPSHGGYPGTVVRFPDTFPEDWA